MCIAPSKLIHGYLGWLTTEWPIYIGLCILG
jgi:hypothetical protein